MNPLDRTAEVGHVLARSSVDEVAKEIMRVAFTTDPARITESGAGNVALRRPSRKTRKSVDLESRTIEDGFFLRCDARPDVLWLVSQPHPDVLLRCPHCGKSWPTTADFAVLETASAAFVECRSEDRIAGILAKHPGFYVPTGKAGRYRCPAAEEWARERHIDYLVFTPLDLGTVERQSLDALGSARDAPLPPPEARDAIVARVARDPGVTKARLVQEGARAEDVDILIANGLVYANILEEPVTDAEHLHLYLDATIGLAHKSPAAMSVAAGAPRPVSLEAGASLLLGQEPFTVLAPGDPFLLSHGVTKAVREVPRADLERLVRDGVVRAGAATPSSPVPASAAAYRAERYLTASDTALTTGLVRAQILSATGPRQARGTAYPKGQSPRTLRRWRKARRDALALTGDPGLGLLPLPASGGGRQLDPRAKKRMLALFDKHVLVPNPLSAKDVHRLLKAELEEARLGLIAPAEKTVARWMRKIDREQKALAQLGDRAAHAVSPYRELGPDEAPPNSLRPWAWVHMDATLLDVETRCPTTGRNLGRPWLTIGIDGFSGLPLFWVLHYEKPSAATSLLALRDCVRRWGRLPEAIVVDQGPDYHSEEFQRFLVWAEVAVAYRPAGQPRFGAPVERLMLEVSRIVKRLSGQTTSRRAGRKLSSDLDPSKLALWDIRSLDRHLASGLALLDDTERVRTGESPRERFDRGIVERGAVPRRALRVDDPGLLAYTLPLVEKPRKVDSVRGISVNYLTYWNDALGRPEHHGTSVEVRYDPHDMSRVWALVAGRWLECTARELRGIRVVSAAEWALLSEAHAKRLAASARRRRVTGAGVVALIREGLETEALLRARLEAQALRAEPIQTAGAAAPERPVDTAPAETAEDDADDAAPGAADLLSEGADHQDTRYYEEDQAA